MKKKHGESTGVSAGLDEVELRIETASASCLEYVESVDERTSIAVSQGSDQFCTTDGLVGPFTGSGAAWRRQSMPPTKATPSPTAEEVPTPHPAS